MTLQRTLRALAAALVLSATFITPTSVAQGANSPSFVAGDVTELVAKVAKVQPLGDESLGTILWIETRNGSSNWAEPLAYKVLPKGATQLKSQLCLRVPGSHYGRAGAAIAPGATRTHGVLCRWTPEQAKKLEVSVARASFFDGEFELPEDCVRVLERKTDAALNPAVGRSTDRTLLRLKNETEYELDAVFLLKLDDRNYERVLVTRRLKPAEDSEWLITELQFAGGFLSDVKALRVELVDVCALLDDGAQLAEEALREAWQPVIGHWQAERLLGGRFSFNRDAQSSLRTSGRFVVGVKGQRQLEFDSALSTEQQGHVGRAFEDLLKLSRYPDAESLVKTTRPTLWSLGGEVILHVESDPLNGMRTGGFYGIVDGRLRWCSFDGEDPGTNRVLRGELVDGGLLHVGQTQYQGFQEEPAELWDIEWKQLDEQWTPVRLRHVLEYKSSQLRESTTLELSNFDTTGTPLNSGAAPSGPLADALRQAWNASYRYPSGKVRFAGRFEMKTPGGAFWLGRRKLKGSFRYEGFDGKNWSERQITIDEKGLGERDQAYLADCVGDRFLIWFNRDPGARGSFDVAFAGASLSGDAARIDISGRAPWRAVSLADGRIVSCDLGSGGPEREYGYKKIGKQFLPSSIRLGESELRVSFKKFSGDWILPVKVEMIRILGPEWGPETLSLSKVKLSTN